MSAARRLRVVLNIQNVLTCKNRPTTTSFITKLGLQTPYLVRNLANTTNNVASSIDGSLFLPHRRFSLLTDNLAVNNGSDTLRLAGVNASTTTTTTTTAPSLPVVQKRHKSKKRRSRNKDSKLSATADIGTKSTATATSTAATTTTITTTTANNNAVKSDKTATHNPTSNGTKSTTTSTVASNKVDTTTNNPTPNGTKNTTTSTAASNEDASTTKNPTLNVASNKVDTTTNNSTNGSTSSETKNSAARSRRKDTKFGPTADIGTKKTATTTAATTTTTANSNADKSDKTATNNPTSSGTRSTVTSTAASNKDDLTTNNPTPNDTKSTTTSTAASNGDASTINNSTNSSTSSDTTNNPTPNGTKITTTSTAASNGDASTANNSTNSSTSGDAINSTTSFTKGSNSGKTTSNPYLLAGFAATVALGFGVYMLYNSRDKSSDKTVIVEEDDVPPSPQKEIEIKLEKQKRQDWMDKSFMERALVFLRMCRASMYTFGRVVFVVVLGGPLICLYPIAVIHDKTRQLVFGGPDMETTATVEDENRSGGAGGFIRRVSNTIDSALNTSMEPSRWKAAEWWWVLLVYFVEFSGPTAVKFGQWSATRRDIFSYEFTKYVSALHSQRRAHSYRHSAKALCRAFDLDDVSEMFDVFEETPLGSGCVAQCHKAKLKGKDEWVVVKILHPHVAESIQGDLFIMSVISNLISLLPGMQWFGLVETVDKFSIAMLQQLDLTIEKENLKLFNENFSNIDSIRFPVPIEPYATPEVLVETYEDGLEIKKYIKNTNQINLNDGAAAVMGGLSSQDQQRVRQKLAKLGLVTFFRMALIHNFVHGDMHPGNILVEMGQDNEPKIVFLDVGIALSLSESDKENFTDLLDGIARNEGEYVGRIMVERARKHNCKDVDKFAKEVGDLVNKTHESRLVLSKVKFGDLLSKMLSLVHEHQVLIESNFTSLMIAVIVMEGLGRSLDPDLDIIKAVLPIVAEAKLKGTL